MINTFEQFLLTEAVWDKTGLLKGKNLLYHYSDSIEQILLDNCLKCTVTHTMLADYSKWGLDKKYPVTCFTRNYMLNYRENWFCLILDKDLLKKAGYKSYPITLLKNKSREDLSEEFIVGDITDLNRYIVGIGISKHLGISKNIIDYNISKLNIIKTFNRNIFNKDINNNKYALQNILKVLNNPYFISNLKTYSNAYPLISLFSGESINHSDIDEVLNNSLQNLIHLKESLTKEPFITSEEF
jgi:hypothetical protein